MATIAVVKPFTVSLDEPPAEGEPTKYTFPTTGTYSDVPDAVATHPYTLLHLEGYEAPPPPASGSGDHVIMTPDPEGEETPPPPA